MGRIFVSTRIDHEAIVRGTYLHSRMRSTIGRCWIRCLGCIRRTTLLCPDADLIVRRLQSNRALIYRPATHGWSCRLARPLSYYYDEFMGSPASDRMRPATVCALNKTSGTTGFSFFLEKAIGVL